MGYTIKEAAQIMGIPATTLRYYDRQGLLPFVERKQSGYRVFSDNDIMLLRVIDCLKRSGMELKDIRQFTEWLREGDASLEKRYQMFLERKKAVEQQMAEMQKTLDMINHKCWYYKTAIEAGTEAIHFKNQSDQLPCE